MPPDSGIEPTDFSYTSRLEAFKMVCEPNRFYRRAGKTFRIRELTTE